MVVLKAAAARCFSFLAHLLDLFRCIESVIGVAGFHQLKGILSVQVLPFALPVGCMHASVQYAFVGVESAPFQAFENIGFGSLNQPLLVSVLNAYNELTSVLPRKEVVGCFYVSLLEKQHYIFILEV